MDSDVLTAIIGAGSAVAVGLATTWAAVRAARKTAAATVEVGLAQAIATRSAGIEQAFAEADSTHALERRSEQLAAYEELLERAQDYLDDARRVIRSVSSHHQAAGTRALRSLREALGNESQEPMSASANATQESLPLQLQPLTELRRAVSRLTIIGGPDDVLASADEIRRRCGESCNRIHGLRRNAITMHRRGGARLQDDGQVLVPFYPEDHSRGGLLLPDPDAEREEAERALAEVSVALNRFAPAVRAYADSSLSLRQPRLSPTL